MKFIIILFSLLCSIINAVVDATLKEPFLPKPEKIIGGKYTEIEDIPYIVSLTCHKNSGTILCTGSIISEWHVITAAHCVTDLKTKNPVDCIVRAGSSHIDISGTLHPMAKCAIHQDFPSRYITSDLAIIKLAKRIEIDNTTRKVISMFEPNEKLEPGSIASIAGWGDVDKIGTSPEQLRSAHMKIMDKEKCKKFLKNNLVGEICSVSSNRNELQTTRHGDSGGPLVIEGKLAGIMSHGNNSNARYPAVFTEVSYFRNWIDDELAADGSNSSKIKLLSIEKFPYLVTLEYETTSESKGTTDYKCLGSILSPLYILTAAHCILETDKPDDLKKYSVRAGSSLRRQNGTVHFLDNATIHPDYKKYKYYQNDIAILKLSKPIEIDHRTKRLIALPKPDEDFISLKANAIRPDWWWKLSSKWFIPDQLDGLKLKVVHNEWCSKILRNGQTIDETQDGMICAGSAKAQNLYGGMAGGPLIINGKLAGISIFEETRTNLKHINVYTNVVYFRKWIDSLMKP